MSRGGARLPRRGPQRPGLGLGLGLGAGLAVGRVRESWPEIGRAMRRGGGHIPGQRGRWLGCGSSRDGSMLWLGIPVRPVARQWGRIFMIDPVTGAVLAKVATASDTVASEVTPKLLARVLGPSDDEIGEALRRWTSYRVGNVQRIVQAADEKSQRLGRHGTASPRVAHILLEEGSYCDDQLMVDYLGGVLAASQSPGGRDDRAVTWSELVTRLSSFHIRAHFILYREWAARLSGQTVAL